MRKRTGIRNRYRTGRGSYSLKRKGESRDRYGKFTNGRRDTADVVAGRTLS